MVDGGVDYAGGVWGGSGGCEGGVGGKVVRGQGAVDREGLDEI